MNNDHFLNLIKCIGDAINIAAGKKIIGGVYILTKSGPKWRIEIDGEYKLCTDKEVLKLGNVIQYYRPEPEELKNDTSSVGTQKKKAKGLINRTRQRFRSRNTASSSRL